MKKLFKKFLAVIMAVVMMLTAAPLSGFVGLDLPSWFDFKAEAATYSGTCGDNLSWSLDTKTGVLEISGTGAMKNWSSYNLVPWYSNSSNFKSVVIGNNVTTIGDYAFYGCTGLKSVVLPSGLTTIGLRSFAGCTNLSNVTIPDTVTSIGKYAFQGCTWLAGVFVNINNKNYSSDEYGVLFNKNKTELIQYPVGNTRTSYAIPDGVNNIADYAFSKSVYLTSVTIPDSVRIIGQRAFYYCYNITSLTIPYGVTTIDDYAFNDCGSLTSIILPDSVTSVDDGAFSGCNNLKYVHIPASVTELGRNYLLGETTAYICSNVSGGYVEEYADEFGYTFKVCGHTSTTPDIPDEPENEAIASGTCGDKLNWTLDENGTLSITGTGAMANYSYYDSYYGKAPWYSYNSQIKTVNISKGVTSIGAYAFYNCYNTISVTIPDSVTSIGAFAFYYCQGLKNITIPDSVTIIDSSAFYYCTNLTSVKIPDKVTEIGYRAFGNCSSLTSVTVGDGVITICDEAFSSCSSINSVTIGKSVTTIGNNAFFGCIQIESVVIPYGTTHIGDYAFASCFNLTSVTLPDSITTIGTHAFSDCSFTSITIPAKVTVIGDWLFSGCEELANITIPNGVTSIGECAFYGCSSLKDITIPDSVISIGDRAFEDCTNLKTITIGAGVTSLGDSLFWYCENLQSITVSSSNKKYSSDSTGVLFNKDKTILYNYPIANSKTSYDIPYGVETIVYHAFYSCANLKNVTIPDTVTDIGTEAFCNAKKLESVSVGDGIKTIEAGTFYYCENLISVNIPDSVTAIGRYAFGECGKLDNIIIPGSVKVIDESAFMSCKNLKNLTISNGVETVGYAAFFGCESLTEIILPDSMKSISNQAFDACVKVKFIHIPKSVTEIGNNVISKKVDGIYICSDTANCYAKTYADEKGIAFKLCDHSSSEPDIPDIPDIPDEPDTPDVPDEPIVSGTCGELTWAIDKDGVLTISGTGAIPDYSASNAPWYAYASSIKKLVIGSGVSVIGQYAFRGLLALVEVSISASVTEIRDGAFEQCGKLVQFIVDAANAYYSTDSYGVLFNKDKTILVQYPIGNTRTSYTVPSTVLIIYDLAFSYCRYIVTITMGNSVITIGNGAFRNCIKLKNITLSNKLKSIGSWVFSFCESLVSITLPDSVTEIGSYVFSECTALKNVKLPSALTVITSYMFNGCTALVNITIPGSVTVIGDYAFAGCAALISIIIPEGVIEIMERAFSGCILMRSITLPASLQRILRFAFESCYNLISIFYSGTESQWNTINISNESNDPLFNGNVWWSWVDVELTIKIIRPSKTTINYGDTLVLRIEETVIPEGVIVAWFVEGAGVSTWVSEDGLECRVTSIANGSVTIYAKLVDEEENVVTNAEGEEIFDEITLVSKAGFWQRLISFFKNLFGINRVIY